MIRSSLESPFTELPWSSVNGDSSPTAVIPIVRDCGSVVDLLVCMQKVQSLVERVRGCERLLLESC